MERYRVFNDMPSLFAYAREEKEWDGIETATLNRYPVRFILFENFEDFNEFVGGIDDALEHTVYTKSVDKWLDAEFPDALITYSDLAAYVVEYIKKLPSNDFVIAPFSELARFYNNEKYKEFDSLIGTVRLAEPPVEAQKRHQRIYIPIIGMHGKMGRFSKDPNIHIWEYKSPNPKPNYELVLTKGGTYGVQGLEGKYSVARTVTEWLSLWRRSSVITSKIICSSKALYNSAGNAMPDNAFSYSICRNAYEFLTKGLGIDFGKVVYREEEDEYWRQLAEDVDLSDFKFESYVSQRFDTIGVSDCVGFIKTWFECDSAYDRWLLVLYYRNRFDSKDYLYRVLDRCEHLSPPTFFSNLAVTIFEEPLLDQTVIDRRNMLVEAYKHGFMLPVHTESFLKAQLKAIAAHPEKGYYAAIRLLTPLTASERELMISWYGEGNVKMQHVKSLYPELYAYLKPLTVQCNVDWVQEYIDAYRESKLTNKVSDKLTTLVLDINRNTSCFSNWYDEFRTTKTILKSRSDIEVIYWIDGLGVDWIPYICSVIERFKHDEIYLNEVYIAAAKLPTTTAVNREDLCQIRNENLPKIGDLDSYAHKHKDYPGYIMEEIRIVTEAIESVLKSYSGKKIAFVSDHGLSYMPQLSCGMHLTGFDADHSGRCGVRCLGSPTADANYIILPDGKCVCSLNHKSLTSKVDSGCGAHGGALPEEVLVPVIIVSSQKNANQISADIITTEVSASLPVVEFKICGMTTVDIPEVIYNGITYKIKNVGNNRYVTERLNLVDTCKSLTLTIGENYRQTYNISVQTGAEEDDLFDF